MRCFNLLSLVLLLGQVPAGLYDYDVVTAEVLLNRMRVRDGRLVLPEGVSYRLLVLRERTVISLPVLRKLKKLVAAGATVLGPRPTHASGLEGFPASDVEVNRLADELWGQRRVLTDQTARSVLQAEGVQPDFDWTCADAANPEVNYIHRRDGAAEIYFVANRSTNAVRLTCTFRVAGKAPELWDAMSGDHHFAAAYIRRLTAQTPLMPSGLLGPVRLETAVQP